MHIILNSNVEKNVTIECPSNCLKIFIFQNVPSLTCPLKLEESLARQKPQEATLSRQSLSTAGTFNVLDPSQKISTVFITQDSHLTLSLDFFIIVSLSTISCFNFSSFHFSCPQPGTKKTPQNPTKNQNKQTKLRTFSPSLHQLWFSLSSLHQEHYLLPSLRLLLSCWPQSLQSLPREASCLIFLERCSFMSSLQLITMTEVIIFQILSKMGHNSGYSLSSVQLLYGTAAQPAITLVFIQLIIFSCSVFFTIKTHILLKVQFSHTSR